MKLLGCIIFLLILSGLSTYAWWDPDWSFRRPIIIDNSPHPDTSWNSQIMINVAYDTDMKPDFADLRFVDWDDVTLLNYWIEEYAPGDSAIAWVKVPLIPALDSTMIFMYYGNPAADYEGNPDSTFMFYDDFESGNLDKWNIILGDWEVIVQGVNHIAHLKQSSVLCRRAVSKISVPEPVLIEAKVKGNASGDVADMAVGFYSTVDASKFWMIDLGTWEYLGIKYFDGTYHHVTYTDTIVDSNNVWYNTNTCIKDGSIYTKRWKPSHAKPNWWQLSHSPATIFGNYIVIGAARGEDNEEFWFDDVRVRGSCVEPEIIPGDEELMGVELPSDLYGTSDIYSYTTPFKAYITFVFSLAVSGNVSLTIYTLAGERIRRVIKSQHYSKGTHEHFWNGQNDAGDEVSQGIYIYIFELKRDIDSVERVAKKIAILK